MTNINFKALREANATRQAEWPGGENIDKMFRALEVADEAGEVIGAIKKIIRDDRGIAGNTKTIEDLADEVADTIIAMDLLAMDLGQDLPNPGILAQHNSFPIEDMAIYLDNAVGLMGLTVLNHVKDTPNLDGQVPNAREVKWRMQVVLGQLAELAKRYAFDLNDAITRKFNKTSAKYGLATTMGAVDA